MKQWLAEWKRFYPFLRICVVHKLEVASVSDLITSMKNGEGVAILSYDGFKKYTKRLKDIRWDYMILDEGHKIKNKETKVSKYCKDFMTRYRLVLTGTPIQNNLSELWTIFDFINPGQLGTYTEFHEEYEEPINRGGYSNATNKQIEAGFRASVLLRNIIEPNILRRLKSQVAEQLPSKIDRVVFSPLSDLQVDLYKKALETDCVFKILTGKMKVFHGIDLLRKICNHPYLSTKDPSYMRPDEMINSTGKMRIVEKLLNKWRQEKRKALIFSQTIGMLNILEIYMKNMGYTYLRMDGKTALGQRTEYVNEFNSNDTILVFLLTTKVGGLGINLVGASRIIIYDPDWNPSTDKQAKERAWRYGQENDVEIYRLISINTIEEKIYHKQIFKNLLSKKILKNPNISKFVNKSDLNDLFSYKEDNRNIEAVYKEEERTEKAPAQDTIKSFLGINIDEEKINSETRRILAEFQGKDMLSGKEMLELIKLREEAIP
jgi:DNA excision repair protein ERCC-6